MRVEAFADPGRPGYGARRRAHAVADPAGMAGTAWRRGAGHPFGGAGGVAFAGGACGRARIRAGKN
jgi:hypothetical protein